VLPSPSATLNEPLLGASGENNKTSYSGDLETGGHLVGVGEEAQPPENTRRALCVSILTLCLSIPALIGA
jgi:hypothetical protein